MLPPAQPKIPIENYLLRLREDIKIGGISSFLKERHKKNFKTYNLGATNLEISESFYRGIISGKMPLPIWVLKKMAKTDQDIVNRIYNSDYYLTIRSNKDVLPKFFSPILAYYIGYLHGDGHVDSNGKRVSFFDKDVSQLEVLSKLTEILFNVKPRLHFGKSVPNLDIGRVTINSFLSEVLGINRGKREKNKIPRDLIKNKDLVKWYLGGLFDAEGCMPLNPKKKKEIYIDIAMKDVNLIEGVKRLLKRHFNISCYGPYKKLARNPHTSVITIESELKIRKHAEIEKFLKTIEILHPDKIRRKNIILKLLDKMPE